MSPRMRYADGSLDYHAPRGRGQEYVAPTAEELAPFVPEDERDYIAATPEPPTVGLCRECDRPLSQSHIDRLGWYCGRGCLKAANL